MLLCKANPLVWVFVAGSCGGSVERVSDPMGVRVKLRFTGQISGDQEEVFYLVSVGYIFALRYLHALFASTWVGPMM